MPKYYCLNDLKPGQTARILLPPPEAPAGAFWIWGWWSRPLCSVWAEALPGILLLSESGGQ